MKKYRRETMTQQDNLIPFGIAFNINVFKLVLLAFLSRMTICLLIIITRFITYD